MKFAHFYDGRAHQFEADPDATDFAIGFHNATQKRKADAFLALATMEKLTDFQKAVALEQAALLDKANADPVIERIPIEAVKMAAQMQNLLSRGKASEVIARFADEDLSRWPFWKRGDGYHLRDGLITSPKTEPGRKRISPRRCRGSANPARAIP